MRQKSFKQPFPVPASLTAKPDRCTNWSCGKYNIVPLRHTENAERYQCLDCGDEYVIKKELKMPEQSVSADIERKIEELVKEKRMPRTKGAGPQWKCPKCGKPYWNLGKNQERHEAECTGEVKWNPNMVGCIPVKKAETKPKEEADAPPINWTKIHARRKIQQSRLIKLTHRDVVIMFYPDELAFVHYTKRGGDNGVFSLTTKHNTDGVEWEVTDEEAKRYIEQIEQRT